MEEHAALRQCQAGHLDAFAELYEAYAQKIFAFLFHKTFDRSLAEDLCSETFLKALDRIESFDGSKGGFQTWLFAIARNTLIDAFRKRRESAPLEDAWDLPSDQDTAAEAEIQLLRQALESHMRRLSPESREILMMRFWQDLSFREIAEILGKSEASVKMSVSRSVKALKKHRGKRKDAASDLGISERTLYRKLKEYDIKE